MGITFFSIPKPFNGHIGIIQRNAIASWTRLPGAEVILFGDEEGLASAAADLHVHHERDIARNAHGTPLVSDAFTRARALANSATLVHVNADIIFTSAFIRAIGAIEHARPDAWMMVGQRHDLDVREPLVMDDRWDTRLLQDVMARGTLHGKSGIDFFAFPKTLPVTLPSMAIGRVGWDSWLIYAIRQAGIPLIDATGVVYTIHQNHPPAYDPAGPEADGNRAAAGGYYRMGSLRDADHRLVAADDGRIAVVSRPAGKLWFAPPVRAGLALRRTLSRRLTGSRI